MRHGLTYAPHIPGAVLDDTEQCLVELVANSVVHGTRPRAKSYWPRTAFVHVAVIDLGDGPRIEVIDQGTKSKKPTLGLQPPEVLEVSGRGLLIVDALSR
ncbi:ATP-binding protein [Spirillospora sp. CA-294931]|uniref:ATP-binding protein n=1 Tax=Spirillospora sp. CA-294931 TaxID=3240042 RepID=UPI003D8A5922